MNLIMSEECIFGNHLKCFFVMQIKMLKDVVVYCFQLIFETNIKVYVKL